MSQRACDVCGGPMDGRPSNAKYCGPICAQSAERDRDQALATQRRLEAEDHLRAIETPSPSPF